MKPVETDRRSQRTERLLSDALIALIQEKRFDKITVQDIIDRADVGRSTFYAHFQDKEDLLISGFARMIELLSQHVEQGGMGSQSLLPSLNLFRHMQEHQHLYEALVWGRSIDFFFRQTQNYLSRIIEAQLASQLPQGQAAAMPLSLMAHHVAGAFITLAKWWLDNRLPYSPERMDEIFRQLIMPGVEAALCIEKSDRNHA